MSRAYGKTPGRINDPTRVRRRTTSRSAGDPLLRVGRLVSFLTSLLTLLSLMAATCCVAQDMSGAISPSARAYVEQVLDLMEKNALNKKSIDWTQVRRDTLERARSAKTTFDTYPAIAYALTQLNEHHSYLQLPDTLPVAQRETITAEMAKTRQPSDSNAARSPFAPRKEMQGHIDRRNGRVFAHVVVPMCVNRYTEWEKNTPDFQRFARELQQIVMDMQKQKPDGWMIDLRGNGGGNMWPMLAGIGPLLGEGDLGAFESPDGDREPWFYKAGKVGTRPSKGPEDSYSYVDQPFVLPGVPWVAVLLDRSTASSGEAVTISFAGRARERSFGEHTAGFSTSNNMYPLSDGALLFLCSGVELDRTGRRYPDGIDPDVKLPAPAARPSEESDAVIKTAEDWIAAQASSAQ
jgi:carboxyl-terminal processing protease